MSGHLLTFGRLSRLTISEYGWILFGFMLMLPFEVFTAGFFLAYLLIIMLVASSVEIPKGRLVLFILYASLVVGSTLVGEDRRISSLINPILVAILFVIDFTDQRKIDRIFLGVYCSLAITSIYLIFVLYQNGFVSFYSLMTNRGWAEQEVPFLGNGFAILVSLAMVLAAKKSNYKLLFMFIVAGILTTSRMPILTAVILLIFYAFNTMKSFSFYLGLVCLISSAILIASINPNIELWNDLQSLSGRIFYSADRIDVYSLAFNTFLENPLLGIGAERLQDFFHAHNSYLHVLSKYGIFAFLIWLCLVLLAFFRGYKFWANLDFVLVFFALSSMQIGLHHPNVVIFILIYCGYLRNLESNNNCCLQATEQYPK